MHTQYQNKHKHASHTNSYAYTYKYARTNARTNRLVHTRHVDLLNLNGNLRKHGEHRGAHDEVAVQHHVGDLPVGTQRTVALDQQRAPIEEHQRVENGLAPPDGQRVEREQIAGLHATVYLRVLRQEQEEQEEISKLS